MEKFPIRFGESTGQAGTQEGLQHKGSAADTRQLVRGEMETQGLHSTCVLCSEHRARCLPARQERPAEGFT